VRRFGDAETAMNAASVTTQVAYSAAIALAMVVAGVGKRRLEWKRRPRKPRRKQ
jgi:hypothetical protein